MFFLQPRFLPDFINLGVVLTRTAPEFALIAGGPNPNYRIAIRDIKLWVRKVLIMPSILNAHRLMLTKQNMLYPLQRTQIVHHVLNQ